MPKTAPSAFVTFLKFHLPALLWGALILTLSSISDFGDQKIEIPGKDKVAHFVEYATFAFLLQRSARRWPTAEGRGRWGIVIPPFLIIALFGILDELWQGHVPGRQTDPWDYLVDILSASLILWVFTRVSQNEKFGVGK